MFGVGVTEFIFILVIAMIVLGPDRLPDAMGKVGRMVRKLRVWAQEFRAEFDEEITMLRGEVESLQREAELTRQELAEIHAEVASTVVEAQEDLNAAAAEITDEVGSATETASSQLDAATASLTNPAPVAGSGQPPAPSTGSAPAANPADAMAGAIGDTFALPNDRDRDMLTAAPRWRPPSAPEPQTPMQLPANGTTMERFAPESGQYAALLRAAAADGADSLGAGQEALARQGGADAGEMTEYVGKGPMAAALLWAANQQAHLGGDGIEIERTGSGDEQVVTVRLSEDPLGLERPIDAPAARLARHYDRAFFDGLGVLMEGRSLLAEGAKTTEFELRPLPPADADEPPSTGE